MGETRIIVSLLMCLLTVSCSNSNAPRFTEGQRKIANEFFEKDVPNLKSIGLIRDIKEDSNGSIVYVNGGVWKTMPYENKKALLSLYSSSKEILGGSPWLKFKDYRSGKVYAEIAPPLTKEVYE